MILSWKCLRNSKGGSSIDVRELQPLNTPCVAGLVETSPRREILDAVRRTIRTLAARRQDAHLTSPHQARTEAISASKAWLSSSSSGHVLCSHAIASSFPPADAELA